jgi:hypothetical protein
MSIGYYLQQLFDPEGVPVNSYRVYSGVYGSGVRIAASIVIGIGLYMLPMLLGVRGKRMTLDRMASALFSRGPGIFAISSKRTDESGNRPASPSIWTLASG